MRIYKKRSLQAGIVAVCSLAVMLSSFPVLADNEIESLENQTSALESELEGINQEILSLSDQISSNEMQVEILNGEIARTMDALAVAEADETKQYEDMKSRIKFMYEHGNATLLEMLFSAESMADFLNKAEFIEQLSTYDRNALDQLIQVHQDIATQKTSLELQRQYQNELSQTLQSQKEELQARADAASIDLAELNQKLQHAREEEARRAAEEAARLAEEEARRAAAEEAARLAAQQAASGSTSSGNASSGSVPTGGTVTNSGSVSATADEVTTFAALLECEAAYDYNCMLAVATVIMNRVADPRFPGTITGVIYASGQFEPVWTGRLANAIARGPKPLSLQVAQDAINGARLAEVSNCYFFLYAPSTSRPGVNIGNNLFFPSW